METDGSRNKNGVIAQPNVYETLNFDDIKDVKARVDEATYSNLQLKSYSTLVTLIAVAVGVALGLVLNREAQCTFNSSVKKLQYSEQKHRKRFIIILLTTVIVVVTLIAVALGVALGLVLNREAQEINECDRNPCVNGGTCVDLVNSYACTCVCGYTGTNCQIDINECDSNPCVNGGTCVNGVNSYTCTCKGGYTGTNCHIDINECASNPCVNEGTCVDLVNSYSCTCVSGYIGTNCHIDLSSLTNVALGKPTSMSSEYGSINGSKLAVDGNTNQTFSGGYFFHTYNELRPWLLVDLEAVYDIYVVRLYNRIDCCGERTIGRECSQDSDCLETASQCIPSVTGVPGKCFCNRLYRYNSTSRDCERVWCSIKH